MAKAKRLKRSRGPSDDDGMPQEVEAMAKAKRLKRSRGSSDDDGMPPEETAAPRGCSGGQIDTGRKKGKMIQSLDEITSKICSQGEMIQSLVNRTDEITSKICSQGEMMQSLVNHMDEMTKIRRLLEKVIETQEKLGEGQNDLRKQLELHTNAPRSQWKNKEEPKYRLEFRSNMDENIDKGKSLGIHVALVDFNSGQTVKDGPLASATVELVVLDAKFNEKKNQHNWSIEDFSSNIKKMDESGESIVSNGRFNLENGDKHHCDFSIFRNSGNKRWRLGVMVVSTTQERVLEGLSNPFFVRGHDRPNRKQVRVDNGNREQHGPMSNMQNPSCSNSTQADGNGPVTTPVLGGQYQPMFQSNTPASSQQREVLRRSMLPQAANNLTGQAWLDNGNQEQNGPMSNMQNLSCPNSTQAYGNGSVISPMFGDQPPFQRNTPMFSTEPATSQQWPTVLHILNNPTGRNAIGQIQTQLTENAGVACTESSASQGQQNWTLQSQDHCLNLTQQPTNDGTGRIQLYPVRLIWDLPSMVPRKLCFNLLDQLMLSHSGQPKFKNRGLPTTSLMQELIGSLMPKEVMQTRRGRGVLIEPLEPDDSDEGWPLKRNPHSKYQLRFVNNVCETYYTWDQIKADEGNLLKVALFDENNTKITSGPLSSASVEIVALHGDFNVDGQEYWTSEEFSRSVVCLCSPPGEEASSVLGGDRILVLADGQACLSDAFFQVASFCARTGKFKMGVMLASVQDERVQEGISESFCVIDNRVKELHARYEPTQGFDPAAATLQFPRNTVTEATQQHALTPLQFSHPKTNSFPDLVLHRAHLPYSDPILQEPDPDDKSKNNTSPALMPPPLILSAAGQANTTVGIYKPEGTPIGVAAKMKGVAPDATRCIVKQKAAAATKGDQPPLSLMSTTPAAQKVQNHHLQFSLGLKKIPAATSSDGSSGPISQASQVQLNSLDSQPSEREDDDHGIKIEGEVISSSSKGWCSRVLEMFTVKDGYAQCKNCGSKLSAASYMGTTHLRRHRCFRELANKPGHITRYPLPKPEIPGPGPEVPELELPDVWFR